MTNLNRQSYQKLIDEDIAWLLSQPRSLERDHIEIMLRWSVNAIYGGLHKQCECEHEHLNEEGICRRCGADCRGIG
jgi:hypothetical protein